MGIKLKLCKCGKVFWTTKMWCSDICKEKYKPKPIRRTTKLKDRVLESRIPGQTRITRSGKIVRLYIKQKKNRINATKRINLPKEVNLEVYNKSKGVCEEQGCVNKAKFIHHLLSVEDYPLLQLELWNLIHLCLRCHRLRHPELPDCLFDPKLYNL